MISLHFSAITGSDNKPYTILSYTNGPGGNRYGPRHNPASKNLRGKMTRYNALVPKGGETHGGEDVAIYSRGPQSHVLRGVVEQNVIFHAMDYALCLSEDAKKQCQKHGVPGV